MAQKETGWLRRKLGGWDGDWVAQKETRWLVKRLGGSMVAH
jgi:hypothetical protein